MLALGRTSSLATPADVNVKRTDACRPSLSGDPFKRAIEAATSVKPRHLSFGGVMAFYRNTFIVGAAFRQSQLIGRCRESRAR
jgi:hypothetical protein